MAAPGAHPCLSSGFIEVALIRLGGISFIGPCLTAVDVPAHDERMIIGEPYWAELEHAYGSAKDVPEMLSALVSGDPDLAGEALAFLDAAVLHQGTFYDASMPAALAVTALLGDARTTVVSSNALPWR